MQSNPNEVVITRKGTDGKNRHTRVYVTGPHLGSDIYSSTQDPAEASRFTREEAERLLAQGKWASNLPWIEDV